MLHCEIGVEMPSILSIPHEHLPIFEHICAGGRLSLIVHEQVWRNELCCRTLLSANPAEWAVTTPLMIQL